MIERRHHAAHDLVIHVVVGNLDESEFRQAAVTLYEMDPPPLLSLWDLSHASVSELTSDRMRAIQFDFAESASRRTGGKTAVVAPGNFTFGVARQYQAHAEARSLPIEHRVFRTKEEALAWLGVDSSLMSQPDGEPPVP